jgi:hypothetical protein
MWHTANGPEDLPVTKGSYVRGSSEPAVMTHPFTGDAYVRADGAPWERHGYKRDTDGDVRPCSLYRGDGNICTVADPAAEACDRYWNAKRKARAA